MEENHIEYVKRSLNSLIKSIKLLKNNYPSLNVNLIILDDRSNEENLTKIKNILDKSNQKYEIINHKHSDHKNIKVLIKFVQLEILMKKKKKYLIWL